MLRFHQPEKVLPHLDPTPDEVALGALFGLDPAGYRTRLNRFEARNRAAAAALAAEPGTAARLAGLPFRPGEHAVSVGESTTADRRLSWFEIQRHLLPDGVRCTNLAVTGSTTIQALANLPTLAFQRPDWVLCDRRDPARVAEYVHFRRAGLGWAGANLGAVAELLLAEPEVTVDTRAAAHGHGEDDGVHPTPAGQQRVAAAVLDALATEPGPP